METQQEEEHSEEYYDELFKRESELQEKLGIKEFSLSLPLEGEGLQLGKLYRVEVMSVVDYVSTKKGGVSYHELLQKIDKLYTKHMEKIHVNCHGTKDEKVCVWYDEFKDYLPCCGEDHRFLESVDIDHDTKTIDTFFGS